ncbi:MAG: hypothetical protein GF334_08250, partial [Candidatus Altiarchaeales archaeon]|nr:hypothetical protein [Candidatus Altiarchaeales archaeon]
MSNHKKNLAALILTLLLIQSVCAGTVTEMVLRGLKWIWEKIVNFFLDAVGSLLGIIYGLLGICLTSTLFQPEVSSGATLELVKAICVIIVPLVEFAILYSALRVLFASVSPGERHIAKNQLVKLLLACLLIPISPYILQLLIDLAHGATNLFLANSINDMGVSSAPWDFASVGGYVGMTYIKMFMIPLVFLTAVAAVIVLLIRMAILHFYAALLPLTILLYLFDLTRGFGKNFLKSTIAWVFTPMLMAIWMLLALAVYPGAEGGLSLGLTAFFLIAFNLLIVASPLMFIGIMEMVGNTVTAAGQMTGGAAGVAMVAAGETMKMKGPQAIMSAGTKMGIGGFRGGIKNAAQKLLKGTPTSGGGGLGRMGGAAAKGIDAGSKAASGGLRGLGKAAAAIPYVGPVLAVGASVAAAGVR